MSVSIQTSQNVSLDYEPASLGDRILATLIDYLIFLAWIVLVFGIAGTVLSSRTGLGSFWSIVLLALPLLLYDLLCEVFLNGQSIGKIAMQIRVVKLDGSPPDWGAYLLRWLLRIIESPLFFGGLIALFTIAINGKGQRVGDIAAGTTVIKLSRPVTLDQVLYRELPEDYEPSFAEAGQLSDRDINIIREALRRRNRDISQLAAERVKQVTGITTLLEDDVFLQTLINDHQFLATRR